MADPSAKSRSRYASAASRSAASADPPISAAVPQSLAPSATSGSPLGAQGFDRWTFRLRDRAADRGVDLLPRLTMRALSTVWRAGRRETAGLCALAVVSAASTTGQLFAARWLLREVLHKGTKHVSATELLPGVIAVAFLTVLTLVVNTWSVQLRRLLGQLVIRTTSRQVFDVTVQVPLTAFESATFFDHVQRVDANSLGKPLDIVNSVVNILSGTLTIGGLTFVIATTEPIVLPLLALSAFPVYLANRAGSRLDFRFALAQVPRQRERAYVGNLMKARDAAKEVRAYRLGPVLRARWEARYGEFIDDLRVMIGRRVAYTVCGAALSAVVLAATMFLLVSDVHGPASLTSVATALIAMRLLAAQLQSAAGGFTGLYESRLFLEDLEEFLAYQPERLTDDGRDPGPLDSVELHGVGFTYPGAAEATLHDISLCLSRGEIVALVGENGSGKTTLAKILAALYQPAEGSIVWNGLEAGEADLETLRSRIAVVFQDYLKYEFTVSENVGLGRAEDSIDSDAVRRAAAQAGADSFIERLPGGYDARLSKVYADGTDLSLGQWQRVALARAFYRDADLVILDEPTAALDPRAEQELFEKTRELFRGRTVVLISHRFSSVRSADRIFVLEQGRIVESGSHDQLIAEGGLYHELFTIQAEAYLGASEVDRR